MLKWHTWTHSFFPVSIQKATCVRQTWRGGGGATTLSAFLLHPPCLITSQSWATKSDVQTRQPKTGTTKRSSERLRGNMLCLDQSHFAPKSPWHDNSLVNANEQMVSTMASKWCRILSTHSTNPVPQSPPQSPAARNFSTTHLAPERKALASCRDST